MKILIVCSGNSGSISPFVKDQAMSLEKFGQSIDFFLIQGRGVIGYLKNIVKLKKIIKVSKPDLIHAHYGFSGFLANLQRKIPVVTTYHGCDINIYWQLILSKITMHLSKYNIFVSSKLSLKARAKNKYSIVSCGVDLDNFKVLDKSESKKKLGLSIEKYYILFSSSFSDKVKNYPLAIEALNILSSEAYNIELIEFKGYDRKTTNILMNAVDCILVTSFRESGPLVIKEAMAVNNCAVSVDVGDVAEITKNLKGYFLTSFNPESVVAGIKHAISLSNQKKRTDGRKRIIDLGLDSDTVAKKIITIYKSLI
jgi:glycosyltransferase involved in cell wall biosynthesis